MKTVKNTYVHVLMGSALALATVAAFAQDKNTDVNSQNEGFAAHLQATKSGFVYENPKTKGLSPIPVTAKQQAVEKQVNELLLSNQDKLLPVRVTAMGYILIELDDRHALESSVDNTAQY